MDEVKVIKNNEDLPESLEGISSTVISPGPGLPQSSGSILKQINLLMGKMPILGVCLGHQAIAEFFGAKLTRSPEIFHGRVSDIYHSQDGIFNNIPSPFTANRYHSWAVSSDLLPSDLEVIARTSDDVIMGLRSKVFPNVCGVQFHPESILTQYGKTLLRNFCEQIR